MRRGGCVRRRLGRVASDVDGRGAQTGPLYSFASTQLVRGGCVAPVSAYGWADDGRCGAARAGTGSGSRVSLQARVISIKIDDMHASS